MAVRNPGAGQKKGKRISPDATIPADVPIQLKNEEVHAAVCAACPLRVRQLMAISTTINEL